MNKKSLNKIIDQYARRAVESARTILELEQRVLTLHEENAWLNERLTKLVNEQERTANETRPTEVH